MKIAYSKIFSTFRTSLLHLKHLNPPIMQSVNVDPESIFPAYLLGKQVLYLNIFCQNCRPQIFEDHDFSKYYMYYYLLCHLSSSIEDMDWSELCSTWYFPTLSTSREDSGFSKSLIIFSWNSSRILLNSITEDGCCESQIELNSRNK